MQQLKCSQCNSKSPKRLCPILKIGICGPCCGQKRSWDFCNIDCSYFKDNKVIVPVEFGSSCVAMTDGSLGAAAHAIYYPNIYSFAILKILKFELDYSLGFLKFNIQISLEFTKNSSKVYGADDWKVPLSLPALQAIPITARRGPLLAIKPTAGGILDPSSISIIHQGQYLPIFIDSTVGYHILPYGRPAYFGPIPPPSGRNVFYQLSGDVIWTDINPGMYNIMGKLLLSPNSLCDGDIEFLWPFGKVEILQNVASRNCGFNFNLSNSYFGPKSDNIYPFEQYQDNQVIVFAPFKAGFDRVELPTIYGQKYEDLPVSYLLNKISFQAIPQKEDIVSVVVPNETISFVLRESMAADSPYGKIMINIYNPDVAARYILQISFINTDAISSKTEVLNQGELKTIFLDIPKIRQLPSDKYESLRILITKNGTCIYDETKEILLAGTQTWISQVWETGGLWNHPIPETIGYYINPHAPEIELVIKHAIQNHPQKELLGDQDHNNIDIQTQAIFEAIKESLEIGYISTTITYGLATNQAGQRLRSFREILEAKAGNCIDLSVLFASVLESLNITGGILLLPGHAMPFWVLDSEKIPLEITVPPGVSFAKAKIAAFNTIQNYKKEQLKWVETASCRAKRIMPYQAKKI